jgi:putative ABC transport system permease protein
MLMINLRTAWRRIRRDRLYSVINIAGLAMGLSVCILIVLFAVDEWGYDKYNEKADRIFRLATDLQLSGGSFHSVSVPSPMGKTLVKEYPAVEASVRIRRVRGDVLVKIGTTSFIESNAVLADSTLFDIFSLPFIAGNPHRVLGSPNSVVLSAGEAERFFGTTNVLGKTLRTDDDTTDYMVTGVMRDMPRQSHFHLTLIKSIHTRFDTSRARQNWINSFAATYVLARSGTTSREIDRMLGSLVYHYVQPELMQTQHTSAAEMARHGDYFHFYSMPLTSIHLHSNLENEFEANGEVRYIYIFLVIAGLILLIAFVNFTNLATARGATQAREVGVRKVIGASRKQLIRQFLTESFVSSCMALVLAMGIAIVLLPWFNRFSGKNVPVGIFWSPWTLPCLLIVALLVGLASGGYPAFFLSGFQPIKVLQGRLATGFRNGWLRTGLLVFQFGVANILIIGTLVIYSQLYYVRHRQLGYTREQVLTIKNTRFLGDKEQLFAEEVRKLPGVIDGTVSRNLPNTSAPPRGFFKDATGAVTSTVLMGDWRIDADYIPTLQMKMVEGRNFSPLMPTDSGGVLINETAARALGLVQPIGKMVYTGPNPVTAYPIIGVVKDFNATSLRDPVEPIVFSLSTQGGAVSVRVKSNDIPVLIAKIKKEYDVFAGGTGEPFVYSFLDDDFNRLYQSDERASHLLTAFSFFAVLIACFGLLGLVTYAAERRTKEIGIRKVLGARMAHVVFLLSKDFGKGVLLAILIACPVAYWVAQLWLQQFVFRTSLHWWIFAIAPLVAVVLTLGVVGAKASRVWLVNPAESLRAE